MLSARLSPGSPSKNTALGLYSVTSDHSGMGLPRSALWCSRLAYRPLARPARLVLLRAELGIGHYCPKTLQRTGTISLTASLLPDSKSHLLDATGRFIASTRLVTALFFTSSVPSLGVQRGTLTFNICVTQPFLTPPQRSRTKLSSCCQRRSHHLRHSAKVGGPIPRNHFSR